MAEDLRLSPPSCASSPATIQPAAAPCGVTHPVGTTPPRGNASSSSITVTVTLDGLPNTAPLLGFVSVTVNASWASLAVSSIKFSAIVLVDSPTAKLSVPLADA